ncbi:MAG: folate-binding protein YgfZ [Alphaproteobacteria bacterium]|nr:folate-binding protein YgfZ [Alphaproteobacteria bacterium]
MNQLSDRAVISLVGPEARHFLQGLITNDIGTVAPGRPTYAALLTPQGKILFDFLLFESDDVLLIDCPRTMRVALVKLLSHYKLRAKVEIAERDDLAVFVGDGPADPRLAALGRRNVGALVATETADVAYRNRRLDLGVPEGEDFGSDKIFALDGGLDELHAISFRKGCYVGQELTARMKHRGTDRKRLLAVDAADGTPLPAGAAVSAAGRDLGTLTSTYGARGFALIRLDRLAETGKAPCHAGAIPVRVAKPMWLFA